MMRGPAAEPSQGKELTSDARCSSRSEGYGNPEVALALPGVGGVRVEVPRLRRHATSPITLKRR